MERLGESEQTNHDKLSQKEQSNVLLLVLKLRLVNAECSGPIINDETSPIQIIVCNFASLDKSNLGIVIPSLPTESAAKFVHPDNVRNVIGLFLSDKNWS